MLTLEKTNKKEEENYDESRDKFKRSFFKSSFKSSFKAYVELVNVENIINAENINSGKKALGKKRREAFKKALGKKRREAFFYFIKNNSEPAIENFTTLIKFLKSKKLLSKLLLKKLLCKPMLDSNDQFNKANFLKYIHVYCVEKIGEYKKLDDFKEVFELLCNNVSGFKKYDLIIETIDKNKNLARNKLTNELTNKIRDIFKQRIKLLIENKGKKENLRDAFKFFLYIEAIYDLINNIPQINQEFISQLFSISSDYFEEMSCAIFSLQENSILTNDNIDFIIQQPKTADNIAIIIVALNKFELFNNKNKEIIKNNAQDISFDLAMIFAEIAKCKSNETNKAIMQNIFDHVFKNLDACKKFAKEICGTISYLQEGNSFTLYHIRSWLNKENYKNSFWNIKDRIEENISYKNDYERLILSEQNGGVTKEKLDRNKNNQMHSLFVDVRNEICDRLKLLSSVYFLNQYILDFLDKDENGNKIDFILCRLNNSNVLESLRNFGLVKELEQLKKEIATLEKQKEDCERDINDFKDKDKNRIIENEAILRENKNEEERLEEKLNDVCKKISDSLKKAEEMRKDIQEQIAKIIDQSAIKTSKKQLNKQSKKTKQRPIKKIEYINIKNEKTKGKKKTTLKETMKQGIEFIKTIGSKLLSLFSEKRRYTKKTCVYKKQKKEKFKGVKSVKLEIKKEDPHKKRRGIKDVGINKYFFKKGKQSSIHDGKPIIKGKSLSLRKNNQL
jgi:hypothetical protein